MIPKIYLSILLTLIFHLSYGIEEPLEKSSFYYTEIAKKYNICPPSLEYGYPINYKHDSLPTTAIIYLKNDLDELYKEDDITYVAEPTKENAEIIFNFSGEIGHYPKFYLIPDSSLTYFEVQQFMEWLTWGRLESRLLLVGYEMRYCQLQSNLAYNWGCMPMIHQRDHVVIMMNSKGQFLYESRSVELDSIHNEIYHHYSDNSDGIDHNPGNPLYRKLSIPIVNNQIEQIQSQIDKYPADIFLLLELKKWIEYKEIVSLAGGAIMHISKSTYIQIKTQGRNQPIHRYYNLFNEINKGLYEARNEYSNIIFSQDYLDLLGKRQFNKLNVLHFSMPELIHHEFGDPYPPEELIATPDY